MVGCEEQLCYVQICDMSTKKKDKEIVNTGDGRCFHIGSMNKKNEGIYGPNSYSNIYQTTKMDPLKWS